jgi:hypothetical protein
MRGLRSRPTMLPGSRYYSLSTPRVGRAYSSQRSLAAFGTVRDGAAHIARGDSAWRGAATATAGAAEKCARDDKCARDNKRARDNERAP